MWMLQVLSLDQIRRLRYFHPETGTLSHLDNVRKRMSRLAKAGYLVGDEIWGEHTRKRERIYRLGKEALEPLSFYHGIEQTRVHRPKGQNTFRQVYHSLLVSVCAVRIVENLRDRSLDTFETPNLDPLEIPFYQTHMVGDARKKKHVERFVSQEDISVPGYGHMLRLRPDLVFALGKENAYRLYFLEADRGTESHAEIEVKLRGYHQYQKANDPNQPGQNLWQRYGVSREIPQEMRDFRVLFVTTTEKRIGLLRASLQGKPGYELVAFTTIEAAKSSNMVSDKVWMVPSGEKVALLKTEDIS